MHLFTYLLTISLYLFTHLIPHLIIYLFTYLFMYFPIHGYTLRKLNLGYEIRTVLAVSPCPSSQILNYAALHIMPRHRYAAFSPATFPIPMLTDTPDIQC
jgi:hypothetical protein